MMIQVWNKLKLNFLRIKLVIWLKLDWYNAILASSMDTSQDKMSNAQNHQLLN